MHNSYATPIGVAKGHAYPGITEYAARKAYRTSVAEASYSTHNFKHLKASTAAEALQFSQGGSPAQYLPGISNAGLEKLALQKGFVMEHGGAYHAFVQFDQSIGYDSGLATSWIRAELSGGVYHGHPINVSRLPQEVRAFFGI